jgi:hypothetical protein
VQILRAQSNPSGHRDGSTRYNVAPTQNVLAVGLPPGPRSRKESDRRAKTRIWHSQALFTGRADAQQGRQLGYEFGTGLIVIPGRFFCC